jgi:hypothetical protein
MNRFFPIFLLVTFHLSVAWAQETTGTISGTITDETGAVLPGVDMTVLNTNTGISRSVISDDEGRYNATSLSLGEYEVQAALAGFQTGVRTGIGLTVGRVAIVDIQLSIGSISERVIVEGEAPLVESTSSVITGLVDDKKIRDLPLNGRSFTQLAALQAGVSSPTNYASGQPGNEGQKLSISGTRITQTAFLLDGGDVRNLFGTTPGSVAGVFLGVETVREFSIVTSAASAEYGGFSGGVINAVTRSGTNELHGSLFEFHRNSALDARNFFDRDPRDPLTRSKPPNFVRNQFGFTVGGPIVRDQTFFFGSMEILRDRLTRTVTSFVPNADMHNGILPASEGGNVGVDPGVQPYLDLYPLPNGNDQGDGTGELIISSPSVTDEEYFMVKIDHNFSDSDSFFGRYTYDDGSGLSPDGLELFSFTRINRSQFLTLEEKHIFSPTVINEARVAFNRNKNTAEEGTLRPVDESLKFLPIPDRTWGNFTASGMAGWGPSALTQLKQVLNRFEYADNLMINRGRHSIKMGVKATRSQFNVFNGVRSNGRYVFLGKEEFLRAQAFRVDSVVSPNIKQGIRYTEWAAYIQDGFQWTPNFTLNLGLRYEMDTNPTEVGGRFSNLDHPDDAELRVGNPLFLSNPSTKNFAPRIGFAWDVFGDGKMSLRGGGGIFYDLINVGNLLGPQYNPPWFPRVTLLNPPFPDFFEFVCGTGDPTKCTAANFTPGIFVYTEPKQAYVAQWNMTLQRELFPLTVVTVGYQGSRGINLSRLLDSNAAPHQIVNGRYFWPVGSQRANTNFDQIRNYFWDGDSYFHSARLGLSKRFSQGYQFQSSYTYSRSIDNASNTANFDGPGSSNGIMNSPFDNHLDRSLSSFDVRHNYTFNATAELPFGPGKAFGNGLTGAAAKILGGWQISTILRLNTGPPVGIRVSGNRSRSQLGADLLERPDLVAGRDNNPVNDDGRNPNQYFDPNAFELQPAGFYGNVGRNTVIGPGVANLDLSFIKDTGLAEEVTLQFRAELFNVFNRANFGNPSNTIFSGSRTTPLSRSGRIGGTTTTSRQIQFALKLVF